MIQVKLAAVGPAIDVADLVSKEFYKTCHKDFMIKIETTPIKSIEIDGRDVQYQEIDIKVRKIPQK